jgi:hypothetical protein
LLPETAPKVTSPPVGLGEAGTSFAVIENHEEKLIAEPAEFRIGAVINA